MQEALNCLKKVQRTTKLLSSITDKNACNLNDDPI